MHNENLSNSILKVTNVEVGYESDGKKVCKEISFSVKKGEVLGILGESGSGKSTLAKAIVGLIPVQDGKITSVSKCTQMIFQDPSMSLNPARRIQWILEEPLKNKGGFTKRQRYCKVKEILEKVGLEETHLELFPKQLSGGQRQRVAIALALILEPDLIVADEPVSALDVTIQAQIIRLLLKLQKEYELSVIFISHDLRVVYQMCDTVMVMKNGRIEEMGSVERVYKNPQSTYMKQLLEAQLD